MRLLVSLTVDDLALIPEGEAKGKAEGKAEVVLCQLAPELAQRVLGCERGPARREGGEEPDRTERFRRGGLTDSSRPDARRRVV